MCVCVCEWNVNNLYSVTATVFQFFFHLSLSLVHISLEFYEWCEILQSFFLPFFSAERCHWQCAEYGFRFSSVEWTYFIFQTKNRELFYYCICLSGTIHRPMDTQLPIKSNPLEKGKKIERKKKFSKSYNVRYWFR